MKKRARDSDGSEVAVDPSRAPGAGAGVGVGVGASVGDEQWLVFQGRRKTLQFWDAKTYFYEKSLPIPLEAYWFGFSPDNKLLAVAFSGKDTQLWDVSTSTFRLEWEIPESDGTVAVAFNCQMSKVAIKLALDGEDDRPRSSIMVWDFNSRSLAFTIEIGGFSTPTLCYGVHGAFLVDICTDVETDYQTLLTAWDSDTGTQLHQFDVGYRDIRGDVSNVALSPSGELAATGSADERVVVVDLNSWTQRACLTAHEDTIYSLAFTSDSGRLVTSSLDNFVIVWSTESWTELVRIGVGSDVDSIAVSPDGSKIACMSQADEDDVVYYREHACIPQIFDAWTGKFLGTTICSRDTPATADFLTQICYSNPPMTILL
jgi:WD40 repeat protein